jgi:hypothetical protein
MHSTLLAGFFYALAGALEYPPILLGLGLRPVRERLLHRALGSNVRLVAHTTVLRLDKRAARGVQVFGNGDRRCWLRLGA